MFERIEERMRRRAEAAAAGRAQRIAARLGDELPPGIGVERVEGVVRLSGRGLLRRLALEPALRALLASIR